LIDYDKSLKVCPIWANNNDMLF